MSGKGDNFERDMCRYLSLWLTHQERPDVLWRNRLRKTFLSPDGKHQLGDIMAERPEGYPFVSTFNVELKVGYSKSRKGKKIKNIPWDLLDMVDSNKRLGQNKDREELLLSFWTQTQRDAEISQRRPLLIFQRDYHVPVVCVEDSLLHLIQSYAGMLEGRSIRLVFWNNEEVDLNFIRADGFFNWLTPEIVDVIYNKKKQGEI